jgi:hypothetical protein
MIEHKVGSRGGYNKDLEFVHQDFFWWDLNSGLHTRKKGTLLLQPHLYSIALVILEMGSHELFAWVGLNQPPNLVSQVSRIIGESHWYPAHKDLMMIEPKMK